MGCKDKGYLRNQQEKCEKKSIFTPKMRYYALVDRVMAEAVIREMLP